METVELRPTRLSAALASTMFRAMIFLLSCGLQSLAADEYPIKKVIPLTDVVDYEPFWSPNGLQIVLISSRHGGMKVHIMNADGPSHGSDMRQLTTGEAEDDSPAWSPDGRTILCSRRLGVINLITFAAPR